MQLTIWLNWRKFEVNYSPRYFDGDEMDFDLFAIYKNKKRKINIDKLSKRNHDFIVDKIYSDWFSNTENQRKQICYQT